MSWRTQRQAIAAVRRDLEAHRGGTIHVHKSTCATRHDQECDCLPRLIVVKPRGR